MESDPRIEGRTRKSSISFLASNSYIIFRSFTNSRGSALRSVCNLSRHPFQKCCPTSVRSGYLLVAYLLTFAIEGSISYMTLMIQLLSTFSQSTASPTERRSHDAK